MNAHSAVVAAVIAQLQQAPAIASGNVYRGRLRPVATGAAQAVVVRFGDSDPQRGAIRGAPIDWGTTVVVECYARAGAAESGDEAALALHADVYARLMSDPTLGGAAGDLAPPRLALDETELAETLGCVNAAYLVQHRTTEHTLEV